MFYSSVTYNGVWSLVGVGVLAAGVPLMLLSRPRPTDEAQQRGFDPTMVNPPTEAMES